MTDDRLRQAYDRLMADRSKEPIEAGVSLEEMLAVLERDGSEDTRLDVMNRVMRHPSHRREFDLLRAAHRASQERPSRMRIVWPISLAAGILLAVFIGNRIRTPGVEGPDVVRGAGTPTVPLYEPAETALADSARSFLWAHVAGAQQYAFTLMDLEGRSLYEISVTDTSVVLPDSVRLTPGAEYRWRVRASTPSGSETSELRPLRLRD